MLTELETRNRKAALDSFVKAVWKGREPEELLPLAGAAGLDGAQADALASRIVRGREWLAQVDQLPRLRKDAAVAQEKFHKAQARLDAERATLQAEAEKNYYLADYAKKAMYAAEDCVQQLLLLHDEGLLLTDTPKDVALLIRRREAEEKAGIAQKAAGKATEERNLRRAVVGNIRHKLATMPIMPPVDQHHHENRLRDRLEEAEVELKKAESALKNAEAVADAAQRAIPTYP